MKYILTLLSTLVLFASCSKDEKGETPTPTLNQRTVVVYMSGENNLTKMSDMDINEIISGAKSLYDNQRIVVFVDKAKEKPFIACINKNSTTSKIDTLYKYSEDFYASSADNFYEVLQRATSLCPAKEYGLVLWGHASGWLVEEDSIPTNLRRAYGADNGRNDASISNYKWMNIPSMRLALEKLGIQWQFIFADCCNMMCAEVGYELRNITHYLISSPAEIPGNGAPYTELVPTFFKSGKELYEGIVDKYYNYYTEYYKNTPSIRVEGVSVAEQLSGHSVPLAVFDTQYATQLANKTKEIVTNIATEYPQQLDLSDIPYYLYYDSPSLYDMKAFIQHYASADEYQDWLTVFNHAVPYARTSLKWMTIFNKLYMDFDTFNKDVSAYGCLSMFIPQNLPDYYSGNYAYNERNINLEWNRVIDWSRFGW